MALTALHHHHFKAMDCEIGFWLAGVGQATAARQFADAEAFIRNAEDALSRFRPTSELSRLNAVGGRQPVSDLLWQVLQAALDAARLTAGLFDPTILPALQAAGYDRSFRELPAFASARAGLPPTAGHWDAITTDEATRTVTLPQGVTLDLGGIAKGWLADAVVQRLGAYGPCLADLGGDIAARSAPADQPGWAVGIADPLHPDQDLVVLALRDAAIATSGRDYRVWNGPLGESRHHIIDPRTSRPAVTDALSVSVVAPSAAEAEALAKVALLLGAGEGAAYLEERGVDGLVVAADGTVRPTPRFTRLEWSNLTTVGAR